MKHIFLKTLGTLMFINLLTMCNVWSHSVSMKASTFIVSPMNGAQVRSPFQIKFGIKHFKIAPAGEYIHKAGHYHLLIDQTEPLSMDARMPSDQQHLDFKQGETEAMISLPPGKHTLQLVVGDEEHEPFEELVSPPISITVISSVKLSYDK
ncbi:MAG: rod shape-determining protein RodA [Gammaproteobacteria bacterium]|nr:MAG: rod shape-determining protein RodA [Gammaproteobacteria bacterium]